jgi:hypothetical protein
MKSTQRNVIWLVTALVILPFAMSAMMKVTLASPAVEGFARMGIPHSAIVPLGIIELTCLVLYVIPRTVILGTLLLTGYLGGAVLANIINHSDFFHALAVGLLVWAGAWLRVPEFRALLPLLNGSEASPQRQFLAAAAHASTGGRA